MSLKNDFKEFLVKSVTISNVTGHDKAGQPSFSAPVTYACFTQEKTVLLEKGNNQSDVSKFQIYLDGDVTVALGDKITYKGKNPVIKDVQKHEEFGKAYSTIIYT